MAIKRKNIISLVVVLVLILSSVTSAAASSPSEIRFNNTVTASSVATISSSGLLTVSNQYQGIPGKTSQGVITTYVEKRTLGVFWTRVSIGVSNNEWLDVIYDYMYSGSHTVQLPSRGTYRITVVYEISGSGGSTDTITRTITKTY